MALPAEPFAAAAFGDAAFAVAALSAEAFAAAAFGDAACSAADFFAAGFSAASADFLAVASLTGAFAAAFLAVVFFAAAGFLVTDFVAAAGFFARADFFTVCLCRCAGTVCDASASVSACSTGAADGVSDALPKASAPGSPVVGRLLCACVNHASSTLSWSKRCWSAVICPVSSSCSARLAVSSSANRWRTRSCTGVVWGSSATTAHSFYLGCC
ncbi:hypothetical protein [Streptomyces sp. CL12-4]|uniref:hypothetical protein n=1 Tax=Streptomyces sp. CL12-4 TaxID=2810306 RepID=UPI001EFB8079|nr:hypothetical protein [Streptomyces sp. CL12-4]MCG8971505.1 hypothetical protein [Streptomyces sp. CL12-4]